MSIDPVTSDHIQNLIGDHGSAEQVLAYIFEAAESLEVSIVGLLEAEDMRRQAEFVIDVSNDLTQLVSWLPYQEGRDH